MIRSRKDDTAVASVSTATKSSSTVVGTPPPKRVGSNSSATAGNSSTHDDKSSLPAPSPASMSFAAALSASSLQYYSQLIAAQGHRVRGTVKKKSSKKKMHDATLWAQVQMPKRMLWSTMSIFLIIPVLIFLWKETHIRNLDEAELREKQYGGKSVLSATLMRKKNQHKEFVTWMAHQEEEAAEDEAAALVDMANETTTTSSSSDSELGALNTTRDDAESLPLHDAAWKLDKALDIRAASSSGKDSNDPKEPAPLTAAEFQEEEEEDDDAEA